MNWDCPFHLVHRSHDPLNIKNVLYEKYFNEEAESIPLSEIMLKS